MKHLFLFGLFYFLTSPLFSQKIDLEGHKRNIIILGVIDTTFVNKNGKVFQKTTPRFFGTGFLVTIDNFYHLVTAKHVVTQKGPGGNLTNKLLDRALFGFFYDKSGNVVRKNINSIKNKYDVNWVFHPNVNVDIGVLPFEVLPNDSLKVVPDSDFLTANKVFETDQIYFASYHPALTTEADLNPIFRGGMVSKKNKDLTVYIDAFAFPGNSGSPVFLAPSSTRFDSKTFRIGGGDPYGGKFIGIIGSYLPYEDIAVSTQTQRPRISFQENSGLTKIWTVDYLNQIISGVQMKNQIQKLKKR